MKPSSLGTLSLLLFFVFLNSLPLLAFSSHVEPVVDIKGNPISTGGEYYIVSAIWGAGGGGLTLGKTGNALCPNTVLQEYRDTRYGLPLKFKIPGESSGNIFTDTPLEIEFSYRPECSSSSKWLMFLDNEIEKKCVGIGGPEDHPEDQIYGGTFKIQKLSFGYNSYKLQFCGAFSTTCNDIGKYNANNGAEGGMRLILTDDMPFMVVFIDYASGIDLIRKYGAE